MDGRVGNGKWQDENVAAKITIVITSNDQPDFVPTGGSQIENENVGNKTKKESAYEIIPIKQTASADIILKVSQDDGSYECTQISGVTTNGPGPSNLDVTTDSYSTQGPCGPWCSPIQTLYEDENLKIWEATTFPSPGQTDLNYTIETCPAACCPECRMRQRTYEEQAAKKSCVCHDESNDFDKYETFQEIIEKLRDPRIQKWHDLNYYDMVTRKVCCDQCARFDPNNPDYDQAPISNSENYMRCYCDREKKFNQKGCVKNLTFKTKCINKKCTKKKKVPSRNSSKESNVKKNIKKTNNVVKNNPNTRKKVSESKVNEKINLKEIKCSTPIRSCIKAPKIICNCPHEPAATIHVTKVPRTAPQNEFHKGVCEPNRCRNLTQKDPRSYNCLYLTSVVTNPLGNMSKKSNNNESKNNKPPHHQSVVRRSDTAPTCSRPPISANAFPKAKCIPRPQTMRKICRNDQLVLTSDAKNNNLRQSKKPSRSITFRPNVSNIKRNNFEKRNLLTGKVDQSEKNDLTEEIFRSSLNIKRESNENQKDKNPEEEKGKKINLESQSRKSNETPKSNKSQGGILKTSSEISIKRGRVKYQDNGEQPKKPSDYSLGKEHISNKSSNNTEGTSTKEKTNWSQKFKKTSKDTDEKGEKEKKKWSDLVKKNSKKKTEAGEKNNRKGFDKLKRNSNDTDEGGEKGKTKWSNLLSNKSKEKGQQKDQGKKKWSDVLKKFSKEKQINEENENTNGSDLKNKTTEETDKDSNKFYKEKNNGEEKVKGRNKLSNLFQKKKKDKAEDGGSNKSNKTWSDLFNQKPPGEEQDKPKKNLKDLFKRKPNENNLDVETVEKVDSKQPLQKKKSFGLFKKTDKHDTENVESNSKKKKSFPALFKKPSSQKEGNEKLEPIEARQKKSLLALLKKSSKDWDSSKESEDKNLSEQEKPKEKKTLHSLLKKSSKHKDDIESKQPKETKSLISVFKKPSKEKSGEESEEKQENEITKKRKSWSLLQKKSKDHDQKESEKPKEKKSCSSFFKKSTQTKNDENENKSSKEKKSFSSIFKRPSKIESEEESDKPKEKKSFPSFFKKSTKAKADESELKTSKKKKSFSNIFKRPSKNESEEESDKPKEKKSFPSFFKKSTKTKADESELKTSKKKKSFSNIFKKPSKNESEEEAEKPKEKKSCPSFFKKSTKAKSDENEPKPSKNKKNFSNISKKPSKNENEEEAEKPKEKKSCPSFFKKSTKSKTDVHEPKPSKIKKSFSNILKKPSKNESEEEAEKPSEKKTSPSFFKKSTKAKTGENETKPSKEKKSFSSIFKRPSKDKNQKSSEKNKEKTQSKNKKDESETERRKSWSDFFHIRSKNKSNENREKPEKQRSHPILFKKPSKHNQHSDKFSEKKSWPAIFRKTSNDSKNNGSNHGSKSWADFFKKPSGHKIYDDNKTLQKNKILATIKKNPSKESRTTIEANNSVKSVHKKSWPDFFGRKGKENNSDRETLIEPKGVKTKKSWANFFRKTSSKDPKSEKSKAVKTWQEYFNRKLAKESQKLDTQENETKTKKNWPQLFEKRFEESKSNRQQTLENKSWTSLSRKKPLKLKDKKDWSDFFKNTKHENTADGDEKSKYLNTEVKQPVKSLATPEKKSWADFFENSSHSSEPQIVLKKPESRKRKSWDDLFIYNRPDRRQKDEDEPVHCHRKVQKEVKPKNVVEQELQTKKSANEEIQKEEEIIPPSDNPSEGNTLSDEPTQKKTWADFFKKEKEEHKKKLKLNDIFMSPFPKPTHRRIRKLNAEIQVDEQRDVNSDRKREVKVSVHKENTDEEEKKEVEIRSEYYKSREKPPTSRKFFKSRFKPCSRVYRPKSFIYQPKYHPQTNKDYKGKSCSCQPSQPRENYFANIEYVEQPHESVKIKVTKVPRADNVFVDHSHNNLLFMNDTFFSRSAVKFVYGFVTDHSQPTNSAEENVDSKLAESKPFQKSKSNETILEKKECNDENILIATQPSTDKRTQKNKWPHFSKRLDVSSKTLRKRKFWSKNKNSSTSKSAHKKTWADFFNNPKVPCDTKIKKNKTWSTFFYKENGVRVKNTSQESVSKDESIDNPPINKAWTEFFNKPHEETIEEKEEEEEERKNHKNKSLEVIKDIYEKNENDNRKQKQVCQNSQSWEEKGCSDSKAETEGCKETKAWIIDGAIESFCNKDSDICCPVCTEEKIINRDEIKRAQPPHVCRGVNLPPGNHVPFTVRGTCKDCPHSECLADCPNEQIRESCRRFGGCQKIIESFEPPPECDVEVRKKRGTIHQQYEENGESNVKIEIIQPFCGWRDQQSACNCHNNQSCVNTSENTNISNVVEIKIYVETPQSKQNNVAVNDDKQLQQIKTILDFVSRSLDRQSHQESKPCCSNNYTVQRNEIILKDSTEFSKKNDEVHSRSDPTLGIKNCKIEVKVHDNSNKHEAEGYSEPRENLKVDKTCEAKSADSDSNCKSIHSELIKTNTYSDNFEWSSGSDENYDLGSWRKRKANFFNRIRNFKFV